MRLFIGRHVSRRDRPRPDAIDGRAPCGLDGRRRLIRLQRMVIAHVHVREQDIPRRVDVAHRGRGRHVRLQQAEMLHTAGERLSPPTEVLFW